MLWLRSGLYIVWLIVTVVPWALAVLVVSVFVRGSRLYWFTDVWMHGSIWGARWICGVQYRLHGFENLPDGPVVLLSKHQSAWETLAYPALLPRPLCYVFKRELLYVPFFGWAMSRLDMVHIDRSKRAQAWAKVAEQGGRYMQEGNWVIMFPEGTRVARGTQGVYKSGGTRLAIAAGVSVLPIAVSSARCWPRKSFLLRPGVIDVSFGKPIASEGRESEELMREVEAWIEHEMRRIDAPAYAVQRTQAP